MGLTDRRRLEYLAKLFVAVAFTAPILIAGQISIADETLRRQFESVGETRVAALIEQLGHENFHMRTSAQQSLDKIGLPAYEQLRKALDHPNIQIARSAEYLLRSQNVNWALESDSVEVRTRLQDYSSLDTNNRQTRLLELTVLGTDDSLLALGRIAKFENNELCSRTAAIELLKKLSDFDESRRKQLAQSLLLTIGDSTRTSTRWLEAFSKQTLGLQPFELSQWTQFAQQLIEDLRRTSTTTFASTSLRENLFRQQKLQVLHFYEWLVSWVRTQHDREQALSIAMQSAHLATDNLHATHEFCTWALSVDLPELVIDIFKRISNQNPAEKTGQAGVVLDPLDPQVLYLVAEAYKQLGEESKANETADRARGIPAIRSALLGQLARNNLPEIQAQQRFSLAVALVKRGLFEWAEAELEEATKLEIGSAASRGSIRLALAELYREGMKYEQAYRVMEKYVNAPPPPDRNLPLAEDFAAKLAHVYWYKALHQEQLDNHDAAFQALMLACELNDESRELNPDIIIFGFQIAKSPAEKQAIQKYFEKTVRRFRSDVAELESSLIQIAGNSTNTEVLANSCNQLAWLLACCNSNVDEAIKLSSRSLEFDPEIESYLDTMARCQFAAGNLESALDYQQRAVAKSPHSRSMKKQLQEIRQAISEKSQQQVDDAK